MQLTLPFYQFTKPKMPLLWDFCEFITRMGADDDYSIKISELLNISNIKEAYHASNRVVFMLHLFQHNDHYTTMDYMERTFQWIALYG
jgi:hypothetical protein